MIDEQDVAALGRHVHEGEAPLGIRVRGTRNDRRASLARRLPLGTTPHELHAHTGHRSAHPVGAVQHHRACHDAFAELAHLDARQALEGGAADDPLEELLLEIPEHVALLDLGVRILGGREPGEHAGLGKEEPEEPQGSQDDSRTQPARSPHRTRVRARAGRADGFASGGLVRDQRPLRRLPPPPPIMLLGSTGSAFSSLKSCEGAPGMTTSRFIAASLLSRIQPL